MRILTEEEQNEYERIQKIKADCEEYDKQFYMYKAMKRKEYEQTMKIFVDELNELMAKYRVPLYDVKDGWVS